MASYVPAVRSGAQLWIAGQPPGPDWGGGQIGREYTIEQGAAAARAAGLNILAQVRQAAGSLDRVRRVVKVVGFVNVAPGMDQAHRVVNGCSDLMVEVFGDAGRHARSAVGTSTLPDEHSGGDRSGVRVGGVGNLCMSLSPGRETHAIACFRHPTP